MMRILVFLTFLVSASMSAQTATEVYLFDFNLEQNTIATPTNVSNNSGNYDNQPQFANDSILYFAKSRDTQTDIASFNLNTKLTIWLNDTKAGSEYSPTQIPGSQNVSAIRLDTTGLQRLYRYSGETSETLVDSIKIGYHAWLDEDELIAFELANEPKLIYINLSGDKPILKTVTQNIGRSLHKVPESQMMSYTFLNQDGVHELYLLDIKDNLNSFYVCDLPIGVQDYTWINRDVLLIGSRDGLYTYDTFVDEDWQKFSTLEPFGLNDISRLDVAPDGKHLAIVVEE